MVCDHQENTSMHALLEVAGGFLAGIGLFQLFMVIRDRCRRSKLNWRAE